MVEFIPVLAAATILLVFLFLLFGGGPTGAETSETVRFVAGENFIVSYTGDSEHVTSLSGNVSKGLTGGSDKRISFQLNRPADIASGELSLYVDRTNLYGPMEISLNGKQIYSNYPEEGVHSIFIDGSLFQSENTIDVESGGSGWRFWAPAIYEFSANLSVNHLGIISKTYDFEISASDLSHSEEATLVINGLRRYGGRLIVNLNGVEIYKGTTNVFQDVPMKLLKEENTLEILPEANTRYDIESAEIVLGLS